MIPFLVGLMPGRAVLILSAFVLSLGTAGVQTVRLANAQAKHAKAEAAWAHEREMAAEEARAYMQSAEDQKRKAQDEASKAIAYLSSRVGELERGRVRDAAVHYASGGQDLASCRARAETLGVLLGQADELAEESARDLERLSADVRLLLSAWP